MIVLSSFTFISFVIQFHIIVVVTIIIIVIENIKNIIFLPVIVPVMSVDTFLTLALEIIIFHQLLLPGVCGQGVVQVADPGLVQVLQVLECRNSDLVSGEGDSTVWRT